MFKTEAIRTAFEPDETIDGEAVRIGHYQVVDVAGPWHRISPFFCGSDWYEFPAYQPNPYRTEKILVIEPK